MPGLLAARPCLESAGGFRGFAPGPAITSLPLLAKGTLAFVPAMLAGLAIARLAGRTAAPQAQLFAE